MVKPPPSVADSNVSDTKSSSLNDTVHKLRNLLFGIALPKTEKAKMATITVEVLHCAHELAGSACALVQECHDGLQLDDISHQIEVIKSLLVTPKPSQPPKNFPTPQPSPRVS